MEQSGMESPKKLTDLSFLRTLSHEDEAMMEKYLEKN